MARQPLPKKYYGRPMVLHRTVPQESALAALIGRCASASAAVEVQFSLTMGCMLGVENPAAVAIFATLQNARARREALNAAALHSLTGELADIYRGLIAIYERLDSSRNEIVHGVWGYIEGVEDASLWCSTQNYATWLIEDYHRGAQRTLSYEWRQQMWRERCYLWKHEHIARVGEDLATLDLNIGSFHFHLRDKDSPAGLNALAELRRAPMLQKVLVELSQSHNANSM